MNETEARILIDRKLRDTEFRAFSATMEQKIANTIARIWEDKP